MRDLFTSFSINLPRDLQKPLNTTQYLDANDTLPGNPDLKQVCVARLYSQVLLPSKLCSFGSTPATRPATKSCVTPPGRNRTSHQVQRRSVSGGVRAVGGWSRRATQHDIRSPNVDADCEQGQ